MRSSKPLGPEAERLVRRHYRLRGYRVLAANWRGGGYELDVVARRGSRLVVCEVKARSGPAFGHPFEAIGPEKARRIRRAAESFLAVHPELAGLEISFEAAAVRGRRVVRAPLTGPG
jgi:putative endonuclease